MNELIQRMESVLSKLETKSNLLGAELDAINSKLDDYENLKNSKIRDIIQE